ncbi:hypothetical protein [Solimonas sp. SE-A11]|uniref:hypothetical protein n=1 Tax=Solimonas sp. SE-A11 TaxID=3054954 RepID=UPI00259CDB9F|nr:hypothetical protein [Solimonas sp. SE-A11]MDM4771498.1 hypothetical protein [Solimonas sp. SE-A11]
MATTRGRLCALVTMLSMLVHSASAQAHGGVSMEDDRCIMKIGPLRAHFTGYQPEKRATQEFCEDIPETGRAIIVIDYVSPVLRNQTVEFRVLRDSKNLQARGRYEDLGSPREIEAATVVHVPAQVYPRGTLNFEHRFDEPGWYIGMIEVTDPATGQVLHSVFPFRVGMRSLWRYAPVFLLLVGAAALAYWLTGRNKMAPERLG